VANQIRPSFILPSSLIIDCVHGGSQTTRTSAAATGGGQRHRDVDFVTAVVGQLPDVHRINEAKVDDVDRDLGIEDLAQLVPDRLRVGRPVGQRRRLDRSVEHLLADGVGVLVVDPEEAEIGLHRVAAAERLVDEDDRAGGQRLLGAGRNLGGGYFSGEGAFALHGSV
jgi:hypothetical protein